MTKVSTHTIPNPRITLLNREEIYETFFLLFFPYPTSFTIDREGVANAGYLDWVLCCGDSVTPSWYENGGSQFNAATWQGETWTDADPFCVANGLELCPYQVYCPNVITAAQAISHHSSIEQGDI